MPFPTPSFVRALGLALGVLASGACAAVGAPGAIDPVGNPAQSPRIGAARALRLVDGQGRALQGTLSEPKWETRGGGLFFTRDFGGTRNIWRAFPDPRDSSRYPRWRALPVTQFAAPLFASGACPLEGDRALLMLSNAADPRSAAQVTLFDLIQPTVSALTAQPKGVLSVAPAPDGQSFAFAAATQDSSAWDPRSRGAAPRRASAPRGEARSAAARARLAEGPVSVWLQSLRSRLASPQLIARNVWHPAWQGADSLLVESKLDNTIFRLAVDEASRRRPVVDATKIAFGTQVSASRDGSTLVVVAKKGVASQLYLLSGDGSGQRALVSTAGAQSPALSGGGQLLVFTAPLNDDPAKERALWILPLQAEEQRLNTQSADAPQEAQLPDATLPIETPLVETPSSQETPPASTAASSEKTIPATRASEPGKETRLPALNKRGAPIAQIRAVQNAPGGALAIWGDARGRGASATLEIGQGAAPKRWEARPLALPGGPDEPLLLWNPPLGARGIWSFRLSVFSRGGAAQSVFAVNLPLASQPAPRQTPLPGSLAGSRVAASPPNRSMPAGGPLPTGPLPDLPAPPLPSPAPLPPLLPAPETPRSGPIPSAPIGAPSTGKQQPSIAVPSRPPELTLPSRATALAGYDAATFNVSNTLAEMRVAQRVSVTFWALNRGTRAWDAAARGTSFSGAFPGGAVRLVTRWVRFESGNRNGWTYQVMKTTVAPASRANWQFDLTAPAQPGRYKLIYALQRVTPGWAPPAYNAPQETWPGDFAAIAFAVTVKP